MTLSHHVDSAAFDLPAIVDVLALFLAGMKLPYR